MQSLCDVHTALIQRGFTEAGPWVRGVYKYTGYLHTTKGDFEVLLFFKTLDKPPSIKLLHVPEDLKPISPHIGPMGTLCYTATGALAIDIFNPASQMLACIEKAEEVLSQILEGKRVHDLADEFFAYWRSEQLVFLDTKNADTQFLSAKGITKDGEFIGSTILTDDGDRSARKLQALGIGVTKPGLAACIIITDTEPMPLTNSSEWPPTSVDELMQWQRALDQKCSKKILRHLKSIYEQNALLALLLISSPTAKYSVSVIFPDIKVRLKSVNHARKIIGPLKVNIMNTVRIDDQYVVERNQPGRLSLMGKKIVLIGAGAIGGYLAELLVKSGAGLGDGKFVILDEDSLDAGNLGRHKLGFESLYKPKSEALATQIKIAFPTVNIEGIVINAKEYPLNGFDLVINASGEQVLGDWLSAELNQKQFTPILHIWIEGPGAVVRTILQSTRDSACYRCLLNMERSALYPATSEPYDMKMAGHGCESLYVPFPATAAVFAASLAAAHIADWVNGKGTPSLRTMLLDRKYQLKSSDQDPSKQSECPACHIIANG